MRRRQFVTACSVGACALGLGLPGCRQDGGGGGGPLLPQRFGRARLVDGEGAPLRADSLEVGVNYVFHYPFVSTPAFLFRLSGPVAPNGGLSDREGRRYAGLAGVGPGQSIVGYCAICVHKLSHPSAQLTYISLRERLPSEAGVSPHVISCCAQNSRFDPYDGARVIDGPADQPLASIVLEHDAGRDELHATGLVGGVVFKRYFETFARRLQVEHGGEAGALAEANGDVVAHRLDEFSGNVLRC
jgi:arsenite oxidase small subunit